MARNGQRVMASWVHHLDELNAESGGPCVLLTPIIGSEFEQRAHRRALALKMAEIAFDKAGLKIGSTQKGALRFFENDKPAAIYLSHATRCGFSAIAVARGPIGVDLELVQPQFEPAWNILHAHEKIMLEKLDIENRDKSAQHHAFLKIWTGKESCLKLDGQGLLVDPGLIEVVGYKARNHANAASYRLDYFETDRLIACLAQRNGTEDR